MDATLLRSHWIMVVMDVFTRRITTTTSTVFTARSMALRRPSVQAGYLPHRLRLVQPQE